MVWFCMKPMLAQSYDQSRNVTGWLMSEKLDGVRAIWDGSQFRSRNGNSFAAPGWFTRDLPPFALDGELYMGRGQFQTAVGVVRKKAPVDSEWAGMAFRVFDAPSAWGGFAKRLAVAKIMVEGCEFAGVVDHRECGGHDDLIAFGREICAMGGEGVMVRDGDAKYTRSRSKNLLKWKPFRTDEAEVIGSEPGTGRLSGTIGAIVVRWGKSIFKVGSGFSDLERTDPPQIGSRITFGFCGLTDGGCPRFPTFIAERNYE